MIGRRIEVVADLDRVRVYCEGRTVADYERVWAWHQTITDPDHFEAAKVLRHLHDRTQARGHSSRLRPVGQADAGHPTQIVVEQRSLADYDAALGTGLDLGFDVGLEGVGGSEGGCAS